MSLIDIYKIFYMIFCYIGLQACTAERIEILHVEPWVEPKLGDTEYYWPLGPKGNYPKSKFKFVNREAYMSIDLNHMMVRHDDLRFNISKCTSSTLQICYVNALPDIFSSPVFLIGNDFIPRMYQLSADTFYHVSYQDTLGQEITGSLCDYSQFQIKIIHKIKKRN